MIAKKTKMNAAAKSSVKNLINYISSSQSKTERVGDVTITNCNSDTIEWATLEIQAVQKMNTRAKSEKTYHLLFSFPDGENPSKEILKDIENELCNALGYAEHQRISVVHHDTDNLHVHVAINKIHPEKFTIHEPKGDFKIMGKKCEELEEKHNLQRTNHESKKRGSNQSARDIESHTGEKTFLFWMKEEHSEGLLDCSSWKELGQYLDYIGVELLPRGNGLVFRDIYSDIAIKASSVDRNLSKGSLEKRLKGQSEHINPEKRNLENLLTDPNIKKDLKRAQTWGEFSGVLQEKGLEIRARGNGLIISDIVSGDSVKASSFDRSFSKPKLESKFGPFPSHKQGKQKGFSRGIPSNNVPSALYQEFLAAKKKAYEYKSLEFARIDKERTKAIDAAKRTAKTKRAAIKLMKGPGVNKRLLYAIVSKDLKRVIDQSHAKSKKRKSNIVDDNRSFKWYSWLQSEAKKGNKSALTALRKRRVVGLSGNHVDGVEQRPDSFLKGHVVDTVTKNGTIVYQMSNCILRDYGKCLKITKGRGSTAIKELLEASVKKFGAKITVNGSDKFKEDVLNVAIKEKMNVRFADKKMETKRLKALNRGRGGRK